MNDVERRLQQTLREHLDSLEMPDRRSVVHKRARKARLLSMATAAIVLMAAILAGGALLDWRDVPEVAEEIPDPARPPLTPVITEELSFRGSGAFDLDAGSGAIWVAAHEGREAFRTRLLKIDPLRNRLKETGVDLGAATVPAEVEVATDTMWIYADELVSVDAATHEVLTNSRVPAPGLAVGHGAVWTTGARVDPSTGRVVAEFPEAGGDEVVSGEDWLWVADWSAPARVSKIDPETNSVVATTSRDGSYVEDIATDGEDAWVAWTPKAANGPVEITEVSGSTDETVDEIVTIPNTDIVVDMTFAAGRLWVVARGSSGGAWLYQVDPEQHRLVGKRLRLDGTLVRLASFGTSLWVADMDRNTITRIDLRLCPDNGCDAEDQAGKANGSGHCPTGIEGDGLEKGEPRPPKPYFYPFNLWGTRIDGKCAVVLAGLQSKWDQNAAMERGIYRRGAVLLMDASKSFTTRDRKFFVPLPAPIRIVDVRGGGMKSELILQSLIDCSLVSFHLLSQDFEAISADYPCAADDPSGHDRPTWVIAECFKPKIRPEEMVFDCATADFTASKLRWAGWNVRAASARGTFECYGSACQWERHGTIRLTKPVFCKDLEEYIFTKAVIVLDKPVDGRRAYPRMLGCGYTRSGHARD